MKLRLYGDRAPTVREFVDLADTLLKSATQLFARPCFIGAELVLGVTQRRSRQVRCFTLNYQNIEPELLTRPDTLIALNIYPYGADGQPKQRLIDDCAYPINNRVGYVARLGPDIVPTGEHGAAQVFVMLATRRKPKTLVALSNVQRRWQQQNQTVPSA